MAIKIFVLIASVAVVKGGVIGAPAALVAAPPLLTRVSDATIDPNPAYSYAYDVQDALTGDSKSHVESRANGIVKGQYTVADPDGTRRIVDYYADPVHGFNAVVRKTPLAVVARAVAPVARVVAPVARSIAPVAAPIVPAPIAPVARLASPYFAAPAPLPVAAPGFARVASPYLAAPAPLPYAPGFASPYAVAPGPIVF